jgi:hypothetical protein
MWFDTCPLLNLRVLCVKLGMYISRRGAEAQSNQNSAPLRLCANKKTRHCEEPFGWLAAAQDKLRLSRSDAAIQGRA